MNVSARIRAILRECNSLRKLKHFLLKTLGCNLAVALFDFDADGFAAGIFRSQKRRPAAAKWIEHFVSRHGAEDIEERVRNLWVELALVFVKPMHRVAR